MNSRLRAVLAFVAGSLLCMLCGPTGAADRGFRVRVFENESAQAPAGELELYRASYALVVGIDAYESGWPRLSNAVKDAREVARALRGQGFEVQEAVNLKRTDLADTLENFFIDKGRDENARLLVWFAGHGYTDAGEGFIMPADAVKPGDAQFRRKALSLRRFGEFMHNARSKHALAIFDACFAGTIFNTARAMPSAAITRSIALPVRAYVSSGDADQQVSDNGEFRKLFVRALAGEEPKADANGDGFLTGTELGLFLSDRVTNLTKGRQVPRYGKLNEAEYDRGDFVFALNTAVAPPYVPPAPPTAPPSGAFSLDDLKKKSQKEKADWATWLASMTQAYADTAAFEKDAMAAVDKAAAWERFQAAFTLDDPFSGEDEKMRTEAARRAGSFAARAREEAAAQAEAARQAREREEAAARNAGAGLDWVRIPGGSFSMGSESGDADEKPVHDATVAGFDMTRTEVTVAQYRACVEKGACTARTTAEWVGISAENAKFWSSACNANVPGRDDHPMNCVDAADAEAFCAFAKGRLPTETEWEYAARGRAGRTYPWGETAPDGSQANACGPECAAWGAARGKAGWATMYSRDDGWPTTAPVGTFKAGRTPEGLLDMSGNVWEWVASNYCSYPSKNCAELARVNRGGGWFDNDASWFRGADRDRDTPSFRSPNLGFRCAR